MFKYAGDPSVIGSVFRLNDKPFTVIGITPPGFFGDTLANAPTDFFLPLNTEPFVRGDGSLLNPANSHWLDLIGRIQPGVAPASLEAQMRLELKQWLRSHWDDMDANTRANLPQQTLYLSSGDAGITSMREAYQHWLQILIMVSGFVLLIVCANVANLMLVRGSERRQETALAVALGARPSRLVRQALTESILLASIGGAAGLGVAFVGTRLILHFAFPTSPGLGSVPISASPSIPVLLFAFVVSLVTGIVFGVAPAWVSSRVDPVDALRGANCSTKRTGSPGRKILAVSQAALSLVLLSVSGLLSAALHNLEGQSFGFEQNERTVVSIDPQLAGYRVEQLTALYAQIHESVARIPGVASLALCAYSPLSGDSWTDGVFVNGRPAPGAREDNSASFERVTAGYFDVIGTRILRGRGITERKLRSKRFRVWNEVTRASALA